MKNTNQPIVFSDLKPDDFVLVRIFHDKEKVFFGGAYGLAIGSYPVLAQSKLEGPADMARVPLTNIRVMGTQTNGPLIFKALFKDTTGLPLKGGDKCSHSVAALIKPIEVVSIRSGFRVYYVVFFRTVVRLRVQ